MNKDIVVLIPVYDPNEEIMDTFLEKLTKKFENIVFINDGCSEKHDKYMKRLAKKYPVVKHNVNLGKGRGLKNGINYILNNYSKPEIKHLLTDNDYLVNRADDIFMEATAWVLNNKKER